ncbi:MAG TPA: preprotein translocase subunit SecG [bacterium]|nr:preprotein translocase subunit SecG [bacterium]
MMILLVSVHVIVCLILILVILLQAGRGQGLTGPSFASGNVQSLFGTRAADFLTKATSVAAIFFLFTCIGLDIIESRKSRSLLEGMNRPAPIDMETIKKALESAKSKEVAKKLETEAADLPATAAVPAPPTPSPASKAPGEPKKS